MEEIRKVKEQTTTAATRRINEDSKIGARGTRGGIKLPAPGKPKITFLKVGLHHDLNLV